MNNGPTNGDDPYAFWTWRLNSGGSVVAISEPGDTLNDLIKQGYSKELVLNHIDSPDEGLNWGGRLRLISLCFL